MPKIFRPKDIEQMKASDVTRDFVDYFNRLSEERKKQFSQDRPDLYAALLSWEKSVNNADSEPVTGEIFTGPTYTEDTPTETIPGTPVDEEKDENLQAILHNAYENVDIPRLIKDDFRPVEALVIDDKSTKCPAHRIPLKEYNPRFHKPNGSILGMMFYHCPECNRLYIKRSRLESNKRLLREWEVPFTFYDYDLTKKYLATQVKPYVLKTDEIIYVPEQWIEENPKCPIHECNFEELPCLLKYGSKSIAFDAYWCDECKKVVLRRTLALKLEDQCAETGLPLVEYQPLVKKTPPKPAIPKREIKPDYLMNEGKRSQYTFDHIADCYKLTEADTVVVSDSIYCTLDGHDTETVLGLIWVTEKASGSRKSYLFMLGYCSECQKYFMDETDYKTIYKVGRLEVTLLLDVADNSYMITSGEVFDLEKKHLCSIEEEINNEVRAIHSQPDYVNQYATISGYDDGNLAYSKAVSKRKYEPRLEELFDYKGRPYQYRVDITADGITEVYYIGSMDVVLNNQKQVISANSKLGRELVHYQTVKVKKDGREYSIKLSRQFDINNAILFGYTNLRTDEDIIFRRGITDPFLVRVLNMRKRQHNLIDIFVTIQENQNSIVDARFEKNLIVQGCAGSGKTMVLLHRLSSLKYNRPGFDFSRDAMILTPNDHFTLHIKGLAESLQIGSISRVSVEQYYKNVLEQYSADFKVGGAFSSEMSVKQIFVDYIYSDEFRASFEKYYLQIISSRNEYISALNSILELMGEKPRDIDVSDDSRVTPQLTTILDGLASKVDASEKRVTNAASSIKENKERKDNLATEIIKKQEYVAKVLREAASRAKTKALASLLEKQRAFDEKKEALSLLSIEKESLERDIESSSDENSPLLADYSLKNSAWIDSGVSDKLQLLSLIQSEITTNRITQERLTAILSIPYEIVISSDSSDDADIARLLKELSNGRQSLEQLQQNRSKIENGWMIGRSRRLAENSKRIEEAEKTIEKHKADVLEVLNARQSELLATTESLERLNNEMLSIAAEIEQAVDQNKRDSLSALKRRITRQTSTIEGETSRLTECLDVVNRLNDEMEDPEIVAWLNQVCAFAPSVNDELRLYDRFLKEVTQVEVAHAGMDEKIALAQQAYEIAVSERYSEEVQNAVHNLRVELARYSTFGTYQMIFDATVQQFKEKNNIKTIAGRNHRYDYYSQLIFAMKFFGKKPKPIRFMCVDEGQDLARNEYRLIYELNDYNVIFNIFGDTNQLIKPNRGISDWTELKRVFHADQYVLNENYRNTNQITRFCNDSFEMSMLQTGVDGAKVREITKKEFEKELSGLQITTERVAVLLPRGVQKRKYFDPKSLSGDTQSMMGEEIAGGRIAVMYVDEVKGIEFDKVYVVSNKMGRNEKYRAYTRALSELIVVVDESVPAYDDSGFSRDIV